MRAPRPAGTPITNKRIGRWVREYAGYRNAVTNTTIDNWMRQFADADRDLAARILDAIEFYGLDRISTGYQQALRSIPGWNADRRQLRGKWRFAPFSQSAGESGDSMLHQFRVANGLDTKAYREMFISTRDIVGQALGPDDTLVLVDDMTATGNQVCTAWNEFFRELVAGAGRVFLVVIAAGKGAKERISTETELSLVPVRQMESRDGLYSDDCRHFRPGEKDKILAYSRRAHAAKPKGFGDCGYLLVFHHRCPNNSIPILHTSSRRWDALFPRHDQQ